MKKPTSSTTATDPAFDARLRKSLIRRALRNDPLKGQNLGPIGNCLSQVADAVDGITDRMAQRKQEQKEAMLDAMAEDLLNRGEVPGAPAYVVRAQRADGSALPDAGPTPFPSTDQEYTGGREALQMMAAVQDMRERAGLNAAKTFGALLGGGRGAGGRGGSEPKPITPYQQTIADRQRQQRDAQEQAREEKALAAAEGIPDSAKTFDEDLERDTGHTLGTFKAGANPRIEGGKFKIDVPDDTAPPAPNPNYRAPEPDSLGRGFDAMFGGNVKPLDPGTPDVPKTLPGRKTVEVPQETYAAYLERLKARETGTPYLRPKRGGDFMPADKYRESIMRSNPAAARAFARQNGEQAAPADDAGAPIAPPPPARPGARGTMLQQPPGAIPSSEPPINPEALGSAEANAIKAAFRAGKLTREQAKAQLAALAAPR